MEMLGGEGGSSYSKSSESGNSFECCALSRAKALSFKAGPAGHKS